jgi:hypothetical protein
VTYKTIVNYMISIGPLDVPEDRILGIEFRDELERFHCHPNLPDGSADLVAMERSIIARVRGLFLEVRAEVERYKEETSAKKKG